jgi:hypothetical protein
MLQEKCSEIAKIADKETYKRSQTEIILQKTEVEN